MSATPTRAYHSPRRRLQAEQTRAAVLDAATSLFAEQGWADTSMRRVAEAAGVSTETVYGGFGSKRDLLAAVLDVAVVGDDLPVPLAQREDALLVGVGTHEERVAKAAALSVTISARTCELIQALTQGSATDPALAQRLTELDERRRGEVAHYFQQVASRAPTRAELDEVWLLTSSEVFHLLVHRSGWTPEQHEHWLADRLRHITSNPPDGPATLKTQR